MAITNGICGKALASGSIVLMARIVDGAGAAIRPLDVRAIEYSVYEVDPYWPELLSVTRGHRSVRVNVRDVLFDSLQVERSWSVDHVGYNFRHELTLDCRDPLSNAEQRFEVAYQVTMSNVGKSIVRFTLRCSILENPSPTLPARGREHERDLESSRSEL
jgi:hypothetical protein